MQSLWICDVNGVLIDSIPVMRRAFVATAAHRGFPYTDRDFDRVKALSLLEAYHLLDPGGDARVCQDLHRRYVRARISEIHAYPHVHDTLSAAKAAGVSVAAVTTHGETAEGCLVSTGLYSLLDGLVTQEEVTRLKPHPDAILRVLDLLGVDRRATEDVIHIGDTPMDIEAGKAAGVRTIGVSYGASTDAEIRAARPSCVIDCFSAMRSFLVEAA